MTIETICDTSVARDSVTKVLDAESSLDSRGKETSEGGDQRSEARYHNRVDLGGRGIELCVTHEGPNTERKVEAFNLENVWDVAFDFFEK